MAIKRHGAGKIKGLSTDTKPVNSEDNAEFIESNTGKIFDYTSSTSTWTERIGEIRGKTTPSATTTSLDFNSDQLQTISISANTTFTTTGLESGKSKTIKITTDGTLRTLTFPAWIFVGSKPTDQAASKISILTITSFGTTDADCVAAFAVEA